MKKNIINSIIISSSLLALTAVQAAVPTAELKVTGTLTVPTCTVAAADNGVYDLGKISATMVKPSGSTSLPAMIKTWTVTCDAETYMNFSPVDNRASSVSSVASTNFGLGSVNTKGKIGYYTATVSNAKVDSAASNLFTAPAGSFNPATTVSIATGSRTGWATTATSTQRSGKVFAADITVSPVLADSSIMAGPITDETKIDGSLTLNFAFGI